MDGLDTWGKQLARRFRNSIEWCKKEMETLRNKGDSDSSLKNDLANLFFEEETLWRQSAKVFWLKDEDINSKFFHVAATSRIEVNRVKSLQDENGIAFVDPSDFCRIACNFFTNLFTASQDPDYGGHQNKGDRC